MDVLTRLANSIVVPVVVLDKAEDAVPTAKAMAAGGVDTMEITFRTACAPEAIKAVAENCPDVLVGAGTIINVEQAKELLSMANGEGQPRLFVHLAQETIFGAFFILKAAAHANPFTGVNIVLFFVAIQH